MAPKNMAIDHDHVTGQVRGLLCTNCNTALGLLKDDQERIASLAEYLSEWEAMKAKAHAD